jgi:hypothetical protein
MDVDDQYLGNCKWVLKRYVVKTETKLTTVVVMELETNGKMFPVHPPSISDDELPSLSLLDENVTWPTSKLLIWLQCPSSTTPNKL